MGGRQLHLPTFRPQSLEMLRRSGAGEQISARDELMLLPARRLGVTRVAVKVARSLPRAVRVYAQGHERLGHMILKERNRSFHVVSGCQRHHSHDVIPHINIESDQVAGSLYERVVIRQGNHAEQVVEGSSGNVRDDDVEVVGTVHQLGDGAERGRVSP